MTFPLGESWLLCCDSWQIYLSNNICCRKTTESNKKYPPAVSNICCLCAFDWGLSKFFIPEKLSRPFTVSASRSLCGLRGGTPYSLPPAHRPPPFCSNRIIRHYANWQSGDRHHVAYIKGNPTPLYIRNMICSP